MTIYTKTVSADQVIQWSVSSGSPHFAQIDDYLAPSNLDYVYAYAVDAGQMEQYTLENVILTRKVKKVRIYVYGLLLSPDGQATVNFYNGSSWNTAQNATWNIIAGVWASYNEFTVSMSAGTYNNLAVRWIAPALTGLNFVVLHAVKVEIEEGKTLMGVVPSKIMGISSFNKVKGIIF